MHWNPAYCIISILDSFQAQMNAKDLAKLQWCIDCINSGSIYSTPCYIIGVMYSLKFEQTEMLELYYEDNKFRKCIIMKKLLEDLPALQDSAACRPFRAHQILKSIEMILTYTCFVCQKDVRILWN